MNSPEPLQIELLKLADGSRFLRATDTATATALERRQDPAQPLVQQKETVMRALRAILDRELKTSAA